MIYIYNLAQDCGEKLLDIIAQLLYIYDENPQS
jgi:hypothetical protein